MSKVLFKLDYDSEMIKIECDNSTLFLGNFWDLNRNEVITVIKNLGHDVVVEDFEFE